MPEIIRFLPAAVKKTFPSPDAPVYPVEAVEFLTSAVPVNVIGVPF